MTDRTAFIAKICERPDDDAPRLVFADWLEEHGEAERAELIRVQIKLDHWPTNDSDVAGHMRFKDRERKLLTPDNIEAWAGDLLDAGVGSSCTTSDGRKWHGTWLADGGIPTIEFDFQRGFVGEISCTAADWLAHHAALAWHPDHCDHKCPPTARPIRTVRLTTWPELEVVGVRSFRWQVESIWPWLTVELPAERERRPNPYAEAAADVLRRELPGIHIEAR